MIKLSVQGNIIIENTEMNDQPDGFFRDFFNNLAKGIKEVFANKVTFIRSSIIGTLVGVIPGIGGSAATFLSYLVATITSNNPESFGKGNPVGLIATEAANDSKDGGALLTTLAFGIPGNMETAVLLGALMMHGITPGPLLVVEQPAIIWSLVFGLILANFIASTVGLLFSIKMSYLAKISTTYIIPVVITISIVSVYLYNRNIMDILVVIFAGFLSFGLEKHGYPLVPLAMGFILGRLGEIYYHQSLQMAWGSHLVFINRPISLILFMLIIFTFGMPVLRKWFNRKKATLR
jgi:putative tricarboxylic transport membrane protein